MKFYTIGFGALGLIVSMQAFTQDTGNVQIDIKGSGTVMAQEQYPDKAALQRQAILAARKAATQFGQEKCFRQMHMVYVASSAKFNAPSCSSGSATTVRCEISGTAECAPKPKPSKPGKTAFNEEKQSSDNPGKSVPTPAGAPYGDDDFADSSTKQVTI